MRDTQKLFFGLDLPDECRQQIIRWRAATFMADAGKPVAAANLHLTLAFLGEVSAQKTRTLMEQAGRISQHAFDLTLDDAGYWPRSGVVWLGPARAPRGLLQLAALLRSQAARCGCPQPAQPYHPHLTLLRQVTRPVALPPRNFHWQLPVSRFVLYQSEYARGSVRYHALAQWELG